MSTTVYQPNSVKNQLSYLVCLDLIIVLDHYDLTIIFTYQLADGLYACPITYLPALKLPFLVDHYA